MEWLENLLRSLLKIAAEWVDKCLPNYQPELWNNADVQDFNNCYNYACNIRTNTFAQPGEASGNPISSLSCGPVGQSAESDGLRLSESSESCGCKDCCHLVALVIWPGKDYHWYRKDKDGKWSHKPGPTEATNLDNSGNLISDPRFCNRGPYTVFCGFYCVCKELVKIK